MLAPDVARGTAATIASPWTGVQRHLRAPSGSDVVFFTMSRYANLRAQRTPKSHTRRARNWRTIRFGDRIVDKHGVVTDWEAVSPPYKKDPWDTLTRIDVLCLACGEFYDRLLNDIIQGKSHRCVHCRNAGRKAPQVGES